MEITLYRHPGHYGRALPLDVFANDQKVASIRCGATQAILLPDGEVTLRVGLGEGAASSPPLTVRPSDDGQRFECGTPWWVLLDFMSLCYLPCLKRRVFFLREAAS